MFNDSPRLIDRVRAEPLSKQKLRLNTHVRGNIGSWADYYCGKTESGTKFNFRSCEVQTNLRKKPRWEAFNFEGATFYYKREKVVNWNIEL